MNEIKVRLSLEIPGATMLSSLDCEKMSKDKAYEMSTVNIAYTVKQGKKKKTKRETLVINTRKSIPARQNISINQDAYNYMIDKRVVPVGMFPKIWNSMSAKKRLEYNLSKMAEYFNAHSFSYEILDD